MGKATLILLIYIPKEHIILICILFIKLELLLKHLINREVNSLYNCTNSLSQIICQLFTV